MVFGAFGLFIAFVSDSCGSSTTCNTNLIAVGMLTPFAVAVLFFVISLVHTIKRIRANKPAWWVPVMWTVLSFGGIGAGFVVAIAGVSKNGSLL